MPDNIPSQTPQTRRALTLDVETYQSMLDMPDVDDDHKRELVEALWLLVVSFIDAGFDVRSAENCGQPAQDAIALDSDKATMLDSFQSKANITAKAPANANMRRKEVS